MAIGMARMMGIILPFNFNSPYKATSIIDFWRCWHMTLSRFIRDYVYIPLGGSQRGNRFINLMLAMLICGLWHGASWTFVAWGGLHGLYLVINHIWRHFVHLPPSAIGRWAGRLVTCLSIVIAWVIFRASSFAAARRMFEGMFGLAPSSTGALIPWSPNILVGLEITPPQMASIEAVVMPLALGGLLAICWALPNTQEFILGGADGRPRHLTWRPSGIWACTLGMSFGLALLYCIVSEARVSEFIYWMF